MPRITSAIVTMALVGANAVHGVFGQNEAINPCLNPAADEYRCRPGTTNLQLFNCGITDADFDDMAACFDDAGRSDIQFFSFFEAGAGSPNGIFGPTMLPDDFFDGLTSLRIMDLFLSALTTLNDGTFAELVSLENLIIRRNSLTTLPEGVFDGLVALESLSVFQSDFKTLPKDIFDGLEALERLSLRSNNLRRLPDGIFDGLVALELLNLENNPLECRPLVPETVTLRIDGNVGTEVCGLCSNGVPGIQNPSVEDICCDPACRQCGGTGCSSENADLFDRPAQACCTGNIRQNQDDCAITGQGPCVIATPAPTTAATPAPTTAPSGPTCSNGVPGTQNSSVEDICCDPACRQCGGTGCASENADLFDRPAQACCTGNIRQNQDDCTITGQGPCVIGG
eukprot:g20738.t1